MAENVDSWFKREVVVYEDVLMAFLRRCWRQRPEEIHDLRQETYIRLYEAALSQRPIDPRAYLFATAKHIMADRIRRMRVVRIDSVDDLEALNVAHNELTPERWTTARQELHALAFAFDKLPPKCREVVWLRRVESLSQRDVARRMGIAQKTVEFHLRKGMIYLAQALLGSSMAGAAEVREADKVHREQQRTD